MHGCVVHNDLFSSFVTHCNFKRCPKNGVKHKFRLGSNKLLLYPKARRCMYVFYFDLNAEQSKVFLHMLALFSWLACYGKKI